ncbi:MAG: Mammalian cell entry related domain protein [Marmoricola sp.]|nr:Mammalian cell entry related domain protein [Marmoricola sp.]
MAILNKWTVVGAAGVVSLGVWFSSGSSGYTASVVLDSATNVVDGGTVLVNGFDAGHIDSINVDGGKARIIFSLDRGFGPLHSGAKATVTWKATLSERQLNITDGPASNPEVASGGVLPGPQPSPVELDDILNSLDATTRVHLASLVDRLNGLLSGQATNVQSTIASGGPALQAAGQLLEALGTDGPALSDLVTRTSGMLNVLAQRDASLQSIVVDLDKASRQVASRRQALGATLQSLPQTLALLQQTLNMLPSVAGQAVPLLHDLTPATSQLAKTSADLAPVMMSLNPLVADLRPALASAKQLLNVAPGLLDSTHAALPGLQTAANEAQVGVNYLRGYTPDAMGFLSTWASAFANYDNEGNYARVLGMAGATSFDENPGVIPPGITNDEYPQPGGLVNQPWTDAAGSGVR